MTRADIHAAGGGMYRLALPVMALVSNMVIAGQAPETTENLLLDDMGTIPMIITPSRMAQPINETAAATTIIDSRLIRASGIRNLPELFRLIPGMVVSYESGHKANVKYHGLDDSGNARHLQVLIDGRSVYQPAFSRVIWSDLPIAIEDIERIEVVRGPSSTIHGSNAFLGVINIITKNPADTHGTTLKINNGTDGVGDGFIRISDSFRDINYRLSVKHQSDDGFDHDSSGNPRYDSQKGNFLNLQAEIPLSDQDTLTIDLGHKRGDKEEPSPDSSQTINPLQVEQWDFNSEHFTWTHDINPNHRLKLQFFHHLSKITSISEFSNEDPDYWRAQYAAVGVANYDASQEEERFDLEIEDTITINNALRISSGGSLRRDYWTSKLYTASRKAKKDTLRLFGNLEWRPTEDTVINAGAMWEREKATGGTADSNLSPRAALNYHLDDYHTLRASYSEAVSTPDLLATNAIWSLVPGSYLGVGTNYLNEIYGVPNATLKPEHITSRELGWMINYPAQHFEMDLKLFKDDASDLFEDTGADYYGANASDAVIINLNHADISGVEGQIRWSYSPSNTLLLNGAHLFHLNSNDWKTSASFPTNSGSLIDIHEFGNGISTSMALYYSGKMVGTDGKIGGPFRRVDTRISREFKIGSRESAELSLVLQHRLDDNPENTQDNLYNDKNKGWIQLGLHF